MHFKYQKEFLEDLEYIINRYGIDNECNTPDYILTNYILQTLITYKKTKKRLGQHNSTKQLPYLEVTPVEYNELCNTGQLKDNVIYFIKDEYKL